MGYFIPGATSIYLIQIVNIIKKSNCIDLNIVLNSFPTIQTEGILIFLILSYVLGHLISYISSITIEKYAVWKYGYPSKYLLDINYLKFWTGAKKFHSIFWRICLIILLLPTVILDYVLGHYFGFKNFYSNKLDPMLTSLPFLFKSPVLKVSFFCLLDAGRIKNSTLLINSQSQI